MLEITSGAGLAESRATEVSRRGYPAENGFLNGNGAALSVRTRKGPMQLKTAFLEPVGEYRSRAVCFGRDPHLLKTRRWLLQRCFVCEVALDLAQLEELAGARHFDLLVLCHTLSEEDCRQAARIARARWKGVVILAVTVGSTSHGVAVADATVESLDGPAVLLGTAVEVVGGAQGRARRV